MLLRFGSFINAKARNLAKFMKLQHFPKKIRKDKLSPRKTYILSKNAGAFFLAPLSGTLTVEAAMVLPVFLFFMIAVLQYGRVMETAVKFGTALSETGRAMAAAAYLSEYGGEPGEGAKTAAGMLSAAYAKRKVLAKSGDHSSVKNVNMVLSSFLETEDRIDLVLTYQIRTPISGIHLPGNFFLQRASVRAWTGRAGSGGGKQEGEQESETSSESVYVAATGRVYHDDPECTHLKLSIREVDRNAVDTLRSRGGAKYHACEKCGAGSGSSVYITNEGNRYHSSLSCSGLKRTVSQVERDQCSLPACSKCGKNKK